MIFFFFFYGFICQKYLLELFGATVFDWWMIFCIKRCSLIVALHISCDGCEICSVLLPLIVIDSENCLRINK